MPDILRTGNDYDARMDRGAWRITVDAMEVAAIMANRIEGWAYIDLQFEMIRKRAFVFGSVEIECLRNSGSFEHDAHADIPQQIEIQKAILARPSTRVIEYGDYIVGEIGRRAG